MPEILTIASRVPDTEAEGPGRRYAVWVQGCPLRCPGCCNPHYLPFESERAEVISAADLAADILRYETEIEGVTFIGGEPFSQAAGLADVARRIRRESNLSVMVFSGFTLAELTDGDHPDYETRRALLRETDLLIDGPYLRGQPDAGRRWIGSANQQIHFLTDRYRHLSDEARGWENAGNTLEIRLRNGELTINGFPHAEFTRLNRHLLKSSQQGRVGESTGLDRNAVSP